MVAPSLSAQHVELIDLPQGGFELIWPEGLNVDIYVACDQPQNFEWMYRSSTGREQFEVQSPYIRHYCKLVSDGHEVTLQQRRFKLAGGSNFRDVGGYSSIFGGTVPWQRLFRSGRLSDFSDDDVAFMVQANITQVVDLRQAREVLHAPSDRVAAAGIDIRHLPIEPGGKSGLLSQIKHTPLSKAQAEKAMLEAFEDFALNQGEHLKAVVWHVLEADAPVLVHCSAGKDRTGVSIALVLRLLGVSLDDVYRDYMLTARYYPPAGEREHIAAGMGFQFSQPEAAEPLMTVDVANLNAFFDTVKARFGSEQQYFEHVLGIDSETQQQFAARWLV